MRSFLKEGGEKMKKYFKKLVGDHIYLSPIHTDDVGIFTEWLNDFETSDYIGRSMRVTSLGEEAEFLAKLQKEEATFGIVTLEHDQLIGIVSLNKIDHIKRRATLGIFIGDHESRNKGYGTEAIRLILDFGFSYLNLNNIDLSCIEFNQRAYRCYQKCGFKEYGRRRKAEFLNGKYYDMIQMDILAEEWKESFIRNKNR